AVHCRCDGVFSADDVGHQRGLLWERYTIADIANVLPTSITWAEWRAASAERRRADEAVACSGSGAFVARQRVCRQLA
ncbi:hypothetical protein ACLOJK_004355, partial [Asimina triloba]